MTDLRRWCQCIFGVFFSLVQFFFCIFCVNWTIFRSSTLKKNSRFFGGCCSRTSFSPFNPMTLSPMTVKKKILLLSSASLASGTKQLGGGSGEGEVTLRIHRWRIQIEMVIALRVKIIIVKWKAGQWSYFPGEAAAQQRMAKVPKIHQVANLKVQIANLRPMISYEWMILLWLCSMGWVKKGLPDHWGAS